MKLNQKGFSAIINIAMITLVVGLVGVAAYRVGVNTSNQNRTEDTATEQELPAKLKVEKEETVKIPKEEEKTEPAKTSEPDYTKKEEPQEIVKKDKVYLSIALQSAVQNGNKVTVHSKIEKAVTGTCNFKLYREGYAKVHTSKKITDSRDCKGVLDVSDMPNYEGWSLHVWFDGSDGKTYAYQKEKSFPLTDPN